MSDVPTVVVDNHCFQGLDTTDILRFTCVATRSFGTEKFSLPATCRKAYSPRSIKKESEHMKLDFYKPEKIVTGPAYSMWFKAVATLVCSALAIYGAGIATRFPLLQYGFGIKAVLFCAATMLAVSYYWFLRSTTTVDDKGITQTWLYNKHVEWRDVRGAKMIGIPYAGWLFPPRLVVRTGNSFTTFNGGSQAVLIEFAKISLTFQMKR